jgi:hypothetical protein
MHSTRSSDNMHGGSDRKRKRTAASKPDHSGGLSAVCTGLSTGQTPETTQNRTSSGYCAHSNGGLSAVDFRTVQRPRLWKHTEKQRFWTRSAENGGLSGLGWRTIRSSKFEKHTERKEFWTGWTPIARLSAGWMVDCLRIAGQNRIAAPQNRLSLDLLDLRPNQHQLPPNLVCMITR